ncbi:hypothetical protein B7463_g5534, partial [Scytalidium lignicola]
MLFSTCVKTNAMSGSLQWEPCVDREQIDRVLRARQSRQKAKACYPCRKRKRRDHPEICVYVTEQRERHESQQKQLDYFQEDNSIQSVSESSAKRRRTTPVSVEESSVDEAHDTETVTPDAHTIRTRYTEANPIISLVRSQAQTVESTTPGDVGTVLGLENSYSVFPFMEMRTTEDRWAALLQIIPSRKDVLTFAHFYRALIYPFTSAIVDFERFELDVCDYLIALSAGEFKCIDKVSGRWITENSVGLISLILAVLAAGAYFSDEDRATRTNLSQDFGRLAQTMGLDRENNSSYTSESRRVKTRTLWANIMCQECLLSLCHGRNPTVPGNTEIINDSSSTTSNLTYRIAMLRISTLGISIMTSDKRSDYDKCLETLSAVDNLRRDVAPHLQSRENCTNQHQHLEHLALVIHMSFFISWICRPAIKSKSASADASRESILRRRARQSLIDVSQAFLDFQIISTVPLKMWSMIHAALCCTLILSVWEETKNDGECRSLTQQVIEIFSSESTLKDNHASKLDNNQWLTGQHIKALVSLRNAFNETVPVVSQQQVVEENPNNLDINLNSVRPQSTSSSDNPPFLATGSLEDQNSLGNTITDAVDITNLSPIAFLDSVMNDYYIGYPEDNNFQTTDEWLAAPPSIF